MVISFWGEASPKLENLNTRFELGCDYFLKKQLEAYADYLKFRKLTLKYKDSINKSDLINMFHYPELWTNKGDNKALKCKILKKLEQIRETEEIENMA
ncbi:hypothetical protein KKC59_03505 [bacterium]|nr:hypothetical protein [bacterium]